MKLTHRVVVVDRATDKVVSKTDPLTESQADAMCRTFLMSVDSTRFFVFVDDEREFDASEGEVTSDE